MTTTTQKQSADLAVFAETFTSTKPSSHQANIVRITEILPHSNADRLEIIKFTGSSYQTVAQKGAFKVDDLAVYVQPDSIVPTTAPFEFIWGEHTVLNEDGTTSVPEKRRRITVKKLRGEYSEGLLMPVKDFFTHTWYGLNTAYPVSVSQSDSTIPGVNDPMYFPGNDVSDVIGITHYDGDNEEGSGDQEFAPAKPAKKRPRYPKSLKGWFFYLLSRFTRFQRNKLEVETDSLGLPVYDVENFKNHKDAFHLTEHVIVTEKIHGSNGRYVYQDGKIYAGSKNYWKSPDSTCIWRKALKQNPWIEEWLKANEGSALYGEVTPTQKGYDYGSDATKVQFFVFDIRRANGTWVNKEELLHEQSLHLVPVLFYGQFQDFVPEVLSGKTAVEGASHITEGYVISSSMERSARGLRRAQLKVKSNTFLEKEGKSK